MGWYAEIVFLLLMGCNSPTIGLFHNSNLPQTFNDEEIDRSLINIENDRIINQYEDAKLEHLGRLLANVLLEPWPRGVSPIIYVENVTPGDVHEESSPLNDIRVEDTEENSNIPFKRSRYYRKYPWKRQNSRYDAENRYLCQPSKDDVFRLLVALHEARQGNRGQIVNFCNRRRPASSIFTNIRFLG